jgi:hypothetical protein
MQSKQEIWFASKRAERPSMVADELWRTSTSRRLWVKAFCINSATVRTLAEEDEMSLPRRRGFCGNYARAVVVERV